MGDLGLHLHITLGIQRCLIIISYICLIAALSVSLFWFCRGEKAQSSVQTIGRNGLNLTVRRRSLQAHLKLATYAPSFSAEHLERHDTCLKLMCWVNFCLALFCAFSPVSPFSGSSGWEASDFSKDDSWADLNSFPQSVALPMAPSPQEASQSVRHFMNLSLSNLLPPQSDISQNYRAYSVLSQGCH